MDVIKMYFLLISMIKENNKINQIKESLRNAANAALVAISRSVEKSSLKLLYYVIL